MDRHSGDRRRLLRQPLKVILSGGLAGRSLPQTTLALKFAAAFFSIFCVGAVGAAFNTRPESFIPFALVLPFAVYQIYCDANRKSRSLLAELLGSTALTASIAVIALAAGWGYPKSLSLWAIITARLIPSILYVRNRLRLEKGKTYSWIVPISAHAAAAGLVLVLAIDHLAPYLPVPMFLILLVRSAIGLSSYRKKVKATKIGIGEVIYGTLTILALIIGHYVGI